MLAFFLFLFHVNDLTAKMAGDKTVLFFGPKVGLLKKQPREKQKLCGFSYKC